MSSFLIHAHGVKLARKDGLFGKSDPFVIIKANGRAVGFSNVVMKDLNPFWSPISVDAESCGGMNGRVTIEVFDFDNDGEHDFIGSTSCTLHDLVSQMNVQRTLLNSTLKKKTKPQGTFIVTKVDVDNKPKPRAYAIHFIGKSLANKDGLLGKSDPFLMVYTNGSIQGESKNKKIFVAKSEWLKNNLNPVWKPLEISVHSCGGLDQELTIIVYDYDKDGHHDLIGECSTTLRQLVTSKPTLLLIDNNKKNSALRYKNSGILSVGTVQETMPKYDDNISRINIQFRAKKLTNKDLFGKSDPYLKIKRDSNFSVFQTPHVKNDLNPVWAAFDLNVADCGGLSHLLTFEVWDYDKGSDDFIGLCKISLRHLLFWELNPTWRLKNPKKMGKGTAGYLEVISLTPFASGASNIATTHQREAMQSHMASMAQPSGYYPPVAQPQTPMYPPNPGYGANVQSTNHMQSTYAPRQDYPQHVPQTTEVSQNTYAPRQDYPQHVPQNMQSNVQSNIQSNMQPNQKANVVQSSYALYPQSPTPQTNQPNPFNQNNQPNPYQNQYPPPTTSQNNANLPSYAKYN